MFGMGAERSAISAIVRGESDAATRSATSFRRPLSRVPGSPVVCGSSSVKGGWAHGLDAGPRSTARSGARAVTMGASTSALDLGFPAGRPSRAF